VFFSVSSAAISNSSRAVPYSSVISSIASSIFCAASGDVAPGVEVDDEGGDVDDEEEGRRERGVDLKVRIEEKE
jgi:hypothetical protein